ncbi:MAG: tRNA uridine-5-carboxymethylaminomethyl(34) synthesis GTPase MnmE [Anaerovoracaceae bacterium]|jgi:tRNA modification GTPase
MNDTIAAISTPYGEGGIGIIRISGEGAKEVLDKIFVPVAIPENRKLTYGNVVDPDTGEHVDEVLAVFMKGPATYTCEDVAEINCHGSVISLRKTLALCYAHGARPAEAGEFTKRAFLGGRLDLSQAEAVMDMISAKTPRTFDVAMGQLEGKLSAEIREIRERILDILVNITVNIDYPDEDIEEIVYRQLEKDVMAVRESISRLLDTADTGRIVREGLGVVIVGKPNVGKSSLMNALLRESRAIVTEIPGTTRDTIEETMNIRDIPVRLTDTAGIRDTEDTIEKIGIERSKSSFNRADLVVFMVDGSKELTPEDEEIIEAIEDKNGIVMINKGDLGQVVSPEMLAERLPKSTIIEASIKEGRGIGELEDAIEALVYGGKTYQKESLMVTNARHEDLLRRGLTAFDDALAMIRREEALDFVEVDVNTGYALLGEIIGETVGEDILDAVFSRFCLGK